MNSTKLCEALGVTRRQLAAWKKRGLPYTREGARHVFDPTAVRDWLVGEGLAEAPRIVRTRDQVAEHYGVHLRTVAGWMAAGCPGKPGAYDLDKIHAWRDHTKKDDPLLAGRSDPELARYRMARAELAELDLEERRRNLIPREEVHRVMEAVATALRSAALVLEKQYGDQAREILEDALDAARRHVVALETHDPFDRRNNT